MDAGLFWWYYVTVNAFGSDEDNLYIEKGNEMLGIFLMLGILTFLLWIGFKITGAVLKACVWLIIEVPIALVIWGVALVCCCTLILIPIGIKLFGAGLRILIPG